MAWIHGGNQLNFESDFVIETESEALEKLSGALTITKGIRRSYVDGKWCIWKGYCSAKSWETLADWCQKLRLSSGERHRTTFKELALLFSHEARRSRNSLDVNSAVEQHVGHRPTPRVIVEDSLLFDGKIAVDDMLRMSADTAEPDRSGEYAGHNTGHKTKNSRTQVQKSCLAEKKNQQRHKWHSKYDEIVGWWVKGIETGKLGEPTIKTH